MSIEFEKEESWYYNEAVKIMRGFENHSIIGPFNKRHTATLESEEIRMKSGEISRLASLLKGWKTSRITFNGVTVDYQEMIKILRAFRCQTYRQETEDREGYCADSMWGCRLLDVIDTSSIEEIKEYNPENVYWFDFGYFEDENTWVISKEDLEEGLRLEIEKKYLEHCPYFKFSNIEKIIRAIPEQVDLRTDKRWKVRYHQTVSGSETMEAVGVMPDLYAESSKIVDENRNIPNVRFSDIGGIDNVVQSIREVIELPLKRPELFRYMGIKPHKGILLYGPPGCGKTMIAKAIANEINAHFIAIKGPELLNKYLGESEANLRKVFSEAREMQPSIIFFDEIDAVAQRRSSNESLRSESRFVTQLLSLMDGIEDYGKICVIASTNRHESLDEALLRPGRFDYNLFINKPTKRGCRDIFKIKTREMPLSTEIDDEQFSEKLFGFTGAEIDFVVREAAYNCLRRSLDLKRCISTDDNYRINLNTLKIIEQDLDKSIERINNMKNREGYYGN
ncbi:MAG TPA: AAA family ATPase [Thermotogota bacterium]|nr:AAA family ATPase [Thermotogota bacterium]HPJ89512.1 AAA family ATPase [Thermotogota bacterium]HPR96609.1 AAA family ATPase [Thermotogota bacterium]